MEAAVIIGGIIVFIGLCMGIWKFNEFVKSRYGGYSYLSIGKLVIVSLAQLMAVVSFFLYVDKSAVSHANAFVVAGAALLIIVVVFIYNAKKTNIILSLAGTLVESLTALIMMVLVFFTFSVLLSSKYRD